MKLPPGTLFQQKVWREIMRIPYGKTRTYKEIAKAIGHPQSYRAVGQACKKNPVPIIIPCHRVIASNGSLGGYSPALLATPKGRGKRLKRHLLDIEKTSKL